MSRTKPYYHSARTTLAIEMISCRYYTGRFQTQFMRVAALGLDVGSKRIGVAGCDGLGLLATGITTIWRSSFQEDVAQLAQIIAERNVELLVIGLPYTMDGNIGSQAKQVQKFARRISAALELPIEYVDERLTSYAAEQMMIEANISVSQNKATIDRIAAAVILQQWLDSRESG
jgi:putative holliday junction resolvase